MEPKTLQRCRSTKTVKKLDDLVLSKHFYFPKDKANDRDPNTGKPVIIASINGKKYYVPVEEITTIEYSVFCVLKDAGVIGAVEKYSIDEGVDPLDKYVI